MSKLLSALKSAYRTAYVLEEIKLWKKPNIYHGGDSFDLTKRWYVYYSYRNPETSVMTRQTPITLEVNRKFKTKEGRLRHLKWIAQETERILKDGYSPYSENSSGQLFTAESALKFALSIKEATLKPRSFTDYENRLDHFLEFLRKRKLQNTPIGSVNKRLVTEFLNQVLLSSSARNRNNTKSVLSALFTVLESNELIDRNFVLNIEKLKTKPNRHKTYTLEMVDVLLTHIEHNDPLLLFFIKVISYNFLRPIEGCRLKIKNINLKEKIVEIEAKNKITKIKRIPEILMPEYSKLNFSNPNSSVFSIYENEDWIASPESKRDHMTDRFLKVKKIFNLDENYTLYSFRHTFVTKIFRELSKEYSRTETLDRLRLITGHDTNEALMMYLRDIDAEIADDYSELLT